MQQRLRRPGGQLVFRRSQLELLVAPELPAKVERKVAPIFDLPELIDEQLRRSARTVAGDMIQFRQYIAKAQTHRVHEKLGFKSWTAYIADAGGKLITRKLVQEHLAELSAHRDGCRCGLCELLPLVTVSKVWRCASRWQADVNQTRLLARR